MSFDVSVARRDIYTSDGEFDTAVYEVQVFSPEGAFQAVQFDRPEQLVALHR